MGVCALGQMQSQDVSLRTLWPWEGQGRTDVCRGEGSKNLGRQGCKAPVHPLPWALPKAGPLPPADKTPVRQQGGGDQESTRFPWEGHSTSPGPEVHMCRVRGLDAFSSATLVMCWWGRMPPRLQRALGSSLSGPGARAARRAELSTAG